ncbi:hypothetical protein RE428_01280 [Marinobacter nanhaiticus D15-8W]|uniref:DUF5666 domain-containing protein n=1 Tax=Marinobacter nanhaiticus D15-8W TaxID=626887 RepID=N6X2B8_9GAMM|nr:hypothetical protein [Marinobacter nanhaiticus]ENO15188.1 hypothetical protein J057_07556 [Marinobacter nanhaiticus D15-8W]BES69110.1 hypothetical protein RE428_01280 [Marinobacter nanhaiticus D15-8W]
MRELTLNTLIAIVLATVSVTANASLADRKSDAAIQGPTVYEPYSGDYTVVRGEIVDGKHHNDAVSAPYSGDHTVVRGEVVDARFNH